MLGIKFGQNGCKFDTLKLFSWSKAFEVWILFEWIAEGVINDQ